ncbi:double zinc ribbon domain-containing protein [Anaerotaenia torta]|uniref:double zinc ribbon domain-containing protein n=1 Tax=Anaerotaenia torta TaxID=433293 RepID=UPI003D1A7E6E
MADSCYYLCPKCNKNYQVGTKHFLPMSISYCDSCGSALVKSCPSCNKPITSNVAEYCRYCGNKYIKA